MKTLKAVYLVTEYFLASLPNIKENGKATT